MQKLIEKYQVAPTAKLAARIKAYDHKHPFSANVPKCRANFYFSQDPWSIRDEFLH
jgi:hypothetical protein